MRAASLAGAVALAAVVLLGCKAAAGPPAVPADAAEVMRVWPGEAPGAPAGGAPETAGRFGDGNIVRNVTVPSLTVFRPAAPNGTAVIIAPGGGMRFLTMDSEGYDLARWLTARGVTAIVLKYRTVPTAEGDLAFQMEVLKMLGSLKGDPAKVVAQMGADGGPAIADARVAVQLVRAQAARLGIDPHRIGLVGFSAGGTVAAGAALAQDAKARPDFVALIYPGVWPTVVAADAPPAFLAVAADDALTAEATVGTYQAWRAAKRPAELHVYQDGGHGFGMKTQGKPSDRWIGDFEGWLADRKLIRR